MRHGNRVKSRPSPVSNGAATLFPQDFENAFRKHFESRFKPLGGEGEKQTSVAMRQVSGPDLCNDSEWNGLSGDDDDNEPLIIECSAAKTVEGPSGRESRVFMSSKPPQLGWKRSVTTPKGELCDENEDGADLQNDLALQRLIRESHILNTSTTGKSSKSKEKIMDSRLQSLGAKSSMLRQDTMPMAHRKGITTKAKNRESKRRKEAAENGIILERASRVKASTKKRDRGIGGAAVGKFTGGTLRLSGRDIAKIRGPRRARVGRDKRR